VVRLIAEHHGGSVHALDLPDNSGVAIMVRLPLVDVSSHASRKSEKVVSPETA
jgi:hypothetical protein